MAEVQDVSIESTLMLLDDCYNTEQSRAMDLLQHLDSVVTSNLPPETATEPEVPPQAAAPKGSTPPLQQGPTVTEATVSEAPEVFQRAAPPQEKRAPVKSTGHTPTLISSRLNSGSFRQKEQNETLIRALQELRTRMQRTRLKSGKIISSQS